MTRLATVKNPQTAREFAIKWIDGNNEDTRLVDLLTELFERHGSVCYYEGFEDSYPYPSPFSRPYFQHRVDMLYASGRNLLAMLDGLDLPIFCNTTIQDFRQSMAD